jgi:hypothetical protein
MTKNQIYGLVAVVVLALSVATYKFMGSKSEKQCCKKEATCEAMTDSSAATTDSSATDTASVKN